MMKAACVGIVKNEAPYIAEWIAYQLSLGFDTVILYDNDSTDSTVVEIRRFQSHCDVCLIEWPDTEPGSHRRAYENAIQLFKAEFDWLAFFDTDEFLVLESDLRPTLAARQGAASIIVQWAMFGSSGHQARPLGLVIENYTQRSEPGFDSNRHFKSIINPRLILKCINSHHFQPKSHFRFWKWDIAYPITDLAGRHIDIDWAVPGTTMRSPDYKGGKLHHYFTRSYADWQAKVERGYEKGTRRRPMGDFHAYDRNEIFDDSAARRADDVRKILSRL